MRGMSGSLKFPPVTMNTSATSGTKVQGPPLLLEGVPMGGESVPSGQGASMIENLIEGFR